MIPQHAPCCPDLYYPANSPGSRPLRCDAVIVTFSPEEEAKARSTAMDRMRVARGLPHLGGDHSPGKELEARTLGALGEILVGRVLGFPFDPKPFGLDVGPYEVRSAGHFDYECPIRRHDLYSKASIPFVLVTFRHSRDVAILRGWITPTEAAGHPEWEAVHGEFGRPAWYVPQAALHDLRRLRDE